MQIAVCDDNTGALAELERQLRLLDRVEGVACFSSLEAFLLSVEEGRRCDAVLLDIDWEGRDEGLDAAERLARLSPRTRIIFVTGYNDRFSQQIFLRGATPSGYLVKPVDQKLLEACLEKAASELVLEEEPALVVRSRGGVLSIPAREILYLEGSGHNVFIHTLRERLDIYGRLDAVQRDLPPGFCRCHKSFVVNMAHIRRFQQPDILLKTGAAVPVSRARYAQAREDYFRFMGQTF